MKKHPLIAAVLAVQMVGIFPARGQVKAHVLDWQASATLYDYIDQRMHEEYRLRDSTLHAALQRGTLKGYQQQCRERYLTILGTFPRKAPLHAHISGTLSGEGYRIEKVFYESFPGHHVTCNLYIPDGRGPFPGLLFFNGHEQTSKATVTYQQTAIRLARNGFVVLSIDPVSQGERLQLTDSSGHGLTRGGTTAHTLLASGSNLVGTSVVAYELWDNERGLDYLCSLPEVDTTKIGCLGNSGGGTQTAYFLPFDPRIKAAAVSSYTTRRERTLELLGPQDGCQWLPGEGKARLDISDYLVMFAPKPVLILAGRYDFVNYSGTRDVYRELQTVYAALGRADGVGCYAADDGHGIQTPKQLAAVRWFRKWFYGTPPKDTLGIPHTLPAETLQVTRTGQVAGDFSGERTIPDRNIALADRWAVARRKWAAAGPARYRAMLIRVLGYDTAELPVDSEQAGSVILHGYRFEKLILRRPGAPPMPCLYGRPLTGVRSGKLELLLSGEGKSQALDNDTLLERAARQGYDIIAADLRGLGETADDPRMNDAKYQNAAYRNAMLALFTGKPLVTGRAEDIRALLDFYRQHRRANPDTVVILATGKATEPALIATCLDHRITWATLRGGPHSFYEFLRDPLRKDQYAYVVPSALQYFDLSDLARFAGPGRVRDTGP